MRVRLLGKSGFYFWAVLSLPLLFVVSCQSSSPSVRNTASVPPDGREELLDQLRQQVGIASPDSLRAVLSRIRTEGLDRSSAGVELFYITDRLYRAAYPMEEQQASLPAEPENSDFPRLFSEALSGAYPVVDEAHASFISLMVSTLSLLKAPVAYQDSSMPEGGERAAVTAEQLIKLNNQTVLPRYLLGRYEEANKEFDKAESYYRATLEKDAGCYPASEALGRIAFSRGEYEISAGYRRDLLQRFPGQLILELQTLESYLAAGMVEDADILLADMIRRYPDNAVVVCKRPLLLELYGRYEQSSRLADALERSYGETQDLLLARARLLLQRNKNEDAIKLLAEGKDRYGTDPFFNAMYELTLLESGSADTARQLLDENRGGQTSIAALVALLKQAMEQGQWQAADGYLTALFRANGRKAEYLRFGVQIASALGKGTVAITYARELSAKDDALVGDRLLLAQSLLSFGTAGEQREASGLIETLLAKESTLNSGDRSRLLYLKSVVTDNPSQKLDLLRSALLEDLQNFDALLAIARLYRERGELKKAYRYFSQAAALRPEDLTVAGELEEVETKLGEADGPVGYGMLRFGE